MFDDQERSDKRGARKRLSAVRDGLDAETRRRCSVAACDNARALVKERSVRSIMIYIAFRSELDLRYLAEWCWTCDLQVIAPRCFPSDRSMTLYEINSWEQLRQGAYGIMEPGEDARLMEERFAPDIVFVPGLGFDREGGRLGYGGGYYDRFAARLAHLPRTGETGTWWVGAGYECQLADRLPMAPHDLALDGVVTEKAYYKRTQ